jgi:hypothetical protein
MCEICGSRYCPPECPMFVGFIAGKGKIIGSCKCCGNIIYATDVYIKQGDYRICENCCEDSNEE